jgi:hypothetical protein
MLAATPKPAMTHNQSRIKRVVELPAAYNSYLSQQRLKCNDKNKASFEKPMPLLRQAACCDGLPATLQIVLSGSQTFMQTSLNRQDRGQKEIEGFILF